MTRQFDVQSRWLLGLALLAGVDGCSTNAGEARAGASTSDAGRPASDAGLADAASTISVEHLGERLFLDTNLSANRTQACATCHDPARAFIDGRRGGDGGLPAASLGADGVSLGDRNSPTVAYARYAPAFAWGTRLRHNTDGDLAEYQGYLGGLFHDGRAPSLAQQAGAPPLNPIEMGMPSERSVVERIVADSEYVAAFERWYGPRVLEDDATAYAAMTEAIAAFERTDEFAPFDSRYDRSLLPPSNDRRYTYNPASPAAEGKALFFSTEFTNCAACHLLHAQGTASAREEPFSGFEYHNIGVPENEALRELNGAGTDLGLGGVLDEPEEHGKFKTPTLRNVAVTAPYMHNGVFRELATVIRFYEHRKKRALGMPEETLDPESGAVFRGPEVDRNLSDDELASGTKDLSEDEHVLALECFLLSLTDARYEALLDPGRVESCGL